MRQAGDHEPLYVSTGDYADQIYDHPAVSPVHFKLARSGLVMKFDYMLDEYLNDEGLLRERTEALLAPLLTRTRCALVDARMADYTSPPWFAEVVLGPATHGRTVAEVFDIAVQAEVLLAAASSGDLTLTTTLELLRGGHVEALLGRSEGPWLDVKSQDYDLSKTSDRGKISLAMDVAKFANGEAGGLIAVGFATKKKDGSETITRVTPVRPLQRGTAQHVKAIDNRVFPPVDGLQVEEVVVGDGSVVLIRIPPQPEESKPFLVQGAIVGEKVEGAFISIVRRRGEDSIPASAASIHSTLAAGRALLRRGAIPPPTGRDAQR